jgi:hypothetical protein
MADVTITITISANGHARVSSVSDEQADEPTPLAADAAGGVDSADEAEVPLSLDELDEP